MNVVVIGKALHHTDYLQYCAWHGIGTFVLEPTAAAPLGDLASCRAALESAVRPLVGDTEIDDVVSFYDAYQVYVDLLKESLGLKARDVSAVRCLTDKARFKRHVAFQGLAPRSIELEPSTAVEDVESQLRDAMGFPVVLKPSNGSSSVGVIRVDDATELARALPVVRRACMMYGKGLWSPKVIVEEYLDGEEFAIDGFVSGGVLLPLLFDRKLPRLVGPYFHETGYVSEPFDDAEGRLVRETLEQLLKSVGLDDSPFHAEVRFDSRASLHVLEVAPRLGGGGSLVMHLLQICTGRDAYAMLHRLGRHEPVSEPPTRRRVGLAYDFFPRRSGFIRNLGSVIEACVALGSVKILRYRSDGEFVVAPPLKMETILDAYFDCADRGEANGLFDILSERCEIETVARRGEP